MSSRPPARPAKISCAGTGQARPRAGRARHARARGARLGLCVRLLLPSVGTHFTHSLLPPAAQVTGAGASEASAAIASRAAGSRDGLPAVGGWVQALPRRARAAAVHALAWLCPVDVRASGSLGAAGCCAADAGARVAHAASCQFEAVVRLHRRRVAHDFALFGAVGLVLECHPRRCSPPSRVCSRREARSCVRTSSERS